MGYGVKIRLDDIPQKKNRGIKGVKGLKLRTGDGLADVIKVGEDDEIVIMSALGKTIRMVVKDIRQVGRNSGIGIRLMSLEEGDSVQSVALVENEEEDE